MTITNLKSITFFVLLLSSSQPFAAQVFSNDIKLTFGGYIQLDALVSRTAHGDFHSHVYLPTFATSNSDTDGETNFLSTAKYSRFNIKAEKTFNNQDVLGFYEIDFNTNTGNEAVTNSLQPRLRHAFVSVNKITVGQTFSTFFNGSAFPETFDFVGPAESVSLVRQPLVRYSGERFSVSLENPETVLSGSSSNTTYNDDLIPDILVELRTKSSQNFSGKIAAVYRYLNVDEGSIDDGTDAYGISMSGKYSLHNQDDFRFQLNAGSGIGRYVGLSLVSADAYAVNSNIEAINLYSAYVSFRHFWTERVRSNFTLGGISVEQSKNQNVNNIDTASSFHSNLIFQKPSNPYKWGFEYIHAKNKLFDETKGDLDRIQVSLNYQIN